MSNVFRLQIRLSGWCAYFVIRFNAFWQRINKIEWSEIIIDDFPVTLRFTSSRRTLHTIAIISRFSIITIISTSSHTILIAVEMFIFILSQSNQFESRFQFEYFYFFFSVSYLVACTKHPPQVLRSAHEISLYFRFLFFSFIYRVNDVFIHPNHGIMSFVEQNDLFIPIWSSVSG